MSSDNRTILSVSELNSEVNLLMSRSFPLLWVEGEISNLARPASGHLYFTLKDDRSQIRCALFRNRNLRISIKPENGMHIVVRGRVGLYEPRGDYQLIAEHMEDAGIGRLQRQFEELKQRLADQGLFDESHKQELPEHPRRIGIITSPSGAAIRDILQVLNRRSPQTPVLIYPVQVQGEKAATQIEMAIRKADADKRCDVLILARGGGSIEDLWSFNDEQLARAIYYAKTPIVCGVGHEIDFTIADFVADIRAPTPSAAAELVAPEREQLLTSLMQIELWLKQRMQQIIAEKQQRLDWVLLRLNTQKPHNKIQQQFQRLDDLSNRLEQNLVIHINNSRNRLAHLLTRLEYQHPARRIGYEQEKIQSIQARLLRAIQHQLATSQNRFSLSAARLDSISPLKTLDRGYSITRDAQTDAVISSVRQAKPEQSIRIQLADGELSAEISAVKPYRGINDKTTL